MSIDVSVTINFKGAAERHNLRRGMGLQALCARVKTPIEFDCRKSDCGICIVHVTAGAENMSPKTVAEADFLRAMHAEPDERLSCQCRVLGDIELNVEEF